jgi:hypothetical protein
MDYSKIAGIVQVSSKVAIMPFGKSEENWSTFYYYSS